MVHSAEEELPIDSYYYIIDPGLEGTYSGYRNHHKIVP